MRGDVEEIVARIVGPGRARVRITAEMDYDRVTQSNESYDPDGQVIRSTQTVDEKSASQDGEKKDAVSVSTKLPDNQAATPPSETASNNVMHDRNFMSSGEPRISVTGFCLRRFN